MQEKNLFETAERQTGVQDWGDARFKDALAALLDSVNQEGRLTVFGRFTFRQFLTENLCSRLRVIEVLKRFPEIRQQNIQRPIFITGWYRTGTTYLQNLLASHPNVRVPLFWELRHPCPTFDPRSADPRRQIRRVHMESRIHRWLAPGFGDAHSMAAEKPEECLHLFDKACAGTTAFFITEAKSFAWWLVNEGIEYGYDFFKIQLQLLNWLRPGRQWVLKWPYHLWHLDTLLKTFPDAAVIQLHRDPSEAIPSVCSLAAAARAPFCEGIDDKALGKFWLDYCEAGLQRGLAAREKAAENRVIDIRYPDLKQNPLSAIHQIQEKINSDESEAWIKSLQTKLKTLDRKVPGNHHYSPDQFGLDAATIRERFTKYIEDYDLSTQ
ncbi:MAG: sulfotransferase [Desulfobacterales bacterium]|nr:MAG: sulfotransferase [Desulfobacterales bacterium]